MTCPNCRTENVHDSSFCSACGTALGDGDAPLPSNRQVTGDVIPHRNLGGLINHSLSVYRTAFPAFALIALIGQVPGLASLFLPTPTMLQAILVGILLGIPVSILVNAATIHAVAQQHLDGAVEVALAFRVAWSRILSLLGAVIIVGIALAVCMILMVILIGLPLFFYVAVSVIFVGEAVIIERKSPLAAVNRSRGIVKGSWWRVFGIGTVGVLIMLGATIAGAIVTTIVSEISAILGSILLTIYLALVFQAIAIGSTILYFDLRSRQESYGLADLARDVGRGE